MHEAVQWVVQEVFIMLSVMTQNSLDGASVFLLWWLCEVNAEILKALMYLFSVLFLF